MDVPPCGRHSVVGHGPERSSSLDPGAVSIRVGPEWLSSPLLARVTAARLALVGRPCWLRDRASTQGTVQPWGPVCVALAQAVALGAPAGSSSGSEGGSVGQTPWHLASCHCCTLKLAVQCVCSLSACGSSES